ncbi:MAG TPA: type II secretion system F family protein [Candidatus Levybacteria bacterium]|nr:type II secretion system F family protein [Candidatus Levybacteria bacterium]
MEFRYTAIQKNGEKEKGIIEANTQKEVIDFLRTKSLTPLSVSEVKKFSASLKMLQKVKTSDIVLFTRQLSSMILTGLTLLESLTILKKQAPNPAMREIIDDLIANVSEGTSLSQALAKHPEAFSEVYIALVQAAEASGLLDKVLARLAENLERSEDLKKQIRSALFYPMIIIVGMMGVITVMNIFVIPQLGTLYESLNLDLPIATQIVLTMSKLFTTFFPVVIVAAIGGFFLFRRFRKTESGIKTIDTVKLRMPVIGKIIHLSIVDEISRTLSLLVTSGSSIIESLNITARVAGNFYYREAINRSSALVEKGVPLSTALDNQNMFEPIVIQMVKVGESTGKMDESLLKLSEYFERDMTLKIKTLTTSIEPLLIIVLGVSVGFLIFSVITPIYSLITQIQ